MAHLQATVTKHLVIMVLFKFNTSCLSHLFQYIFLCTGILWRTSESAHSLPQVFLIWSILKSWSCLFIIRILGICIPVDQKTGAKSAHSSLRFYL